MSKAYETMTDRIIGALEAGVIPWRKEWRTTGKKAGLPYNLVSGKPYRGVNIFSLFCSGYSSSGWCTYKQAQSLGFQVRKGEKAAPVIFWKFPAKADPAALDEKAYFPFARVYSVFNADQLDGMPAALPLDDAPAFDPIQECEGIISAFMVSASHPTLSYGGDSAYYQNSRDHVQMPARESFHSAGGYYSTLFHEFAHSTGHESRLNRADLISKAAFGSEEYSREELTAEFTAAFLCAESGCSNEERFSNSVAYIQGWLKRLKNDKTLAVQAAQRAQKAADFILGRAAGSVADSESEAA